MTDPIALARRLVAIPSVTGEEAEVARFLGSHLTGLGYHVELQEAAPGRPNILATTDAPPRVVLSTHLDTVPPHLPAGEDEACLYGRGACDAKGIAAAMVAAAERLRAEGVSEIGLLFVVDEEMDSRGARAANGHPLARQCRWLINGEPTDNRLAVGSKGSLRCSLRTEGTGGHSAYPERGASAIDRLLEVLADVRAVRWPRDAVLGETTCNIGVIAGGTRPNVIAEKAHADLQVRLVADPAPVRRLLEEAVRGRAEIEVHTCVSPVRLTAPPGFETCVVAFTTDIPNLTAWGSPLLLGPGSIHVAHTDREQIAKADLEHGAELYVRLARALLTEHRVVAAR
ncbi:MAG: M20/M25/M40 family metallo-hydrolase [Gemmatimonadetes bacterium]|nr:M20/M25/M40 family metallo-hydrolase [Gemmatimonadota bacterium]